jgi:hypothetical protein
MTNKFVNKKTVIASYLTLTNLLAFIYLSSSSEVDLIAQQEGTISIARATALPLVNTEGNQVKLVINYSLGSESLVGERLNAVMGIYNRLNGSLIKLSSFPDGFVLNNTAGTIQVTSTLTDPNIQNISTIVTLTNAEKFEKYSNDVRTDLDLEAILPTSLPVPTLSETLAPPPSAPPPPQLPPASTENNGEDDDDSNSNSDDE